MTHGIRIQLFKVRSFSLQFARKLDSKLRNLYSLDSDSIRQYRHEQNTNEQWCPLTEVSEDQAAFLATNSSLSEYGILGFELGYSQENPRQSPRI